MLSAAFLLTLLLFQYPTDNKEFPIAKDAQVSRFSGRDGRLTSSLDIPCWILDIQLSFPISFFD
jgi:hypothetical protein